MENVQCVCYSRILREITILAAETPLSVRDARWKERRERFDFPAKTIYISGISGNSNSDLEERLLRRRVPLWRYGTRLPKRPQQLFLDRWVRRIPEEAE